MTTHEINLLIERYLDGATTPAEERELALAVQREDRPAEWAIIAEMLGELTVYEALWTPRAPRAGGMVTTSLEGDSDKGVSSSPRSGGLRGGLRWFSAAACVAIAFGLSYYIIKEEPQETAKVGPQETTKVEPQETAKVEPPLPAKSAPSEPVLSCDWSHNRAAAPRAKSLPSAAEAAALTPASTPDTTPGTTPGTTPDSPHLEPLPEVEPQLIAEAQEPTPQPEDLALYMALLAEVEARAFQVEQSEQQLYQAILDELLANIQQQSNRPELSL